MVDLPWKSESIFLRSCLHSFDKFIVLKKKRGEHLFVTKLLLDHFTESLAIHHRLICFGFAQLIFNRRRKSKSQHNNSTQSQFWETPK